MAYGKGVNWSGSSKAMTKSKATAFVVEFHDRPAVSLPIAILNEPNGVAVSRQIAHAWNETDATGDVMARPYYDPFTSGGTVTLDAKAEPKILRMSVKFESGDIVEIPHFDTGDFGYGKPVLVEGFLVRNVRPGILFPTL
jgi:hypothetical protein